MFGIGTPELLVILLVVLLLFGAKKLPELAQGLGKGIREFRKASSEIQDELDINKPLRSADSKKDSEDTEKKSESKEDTKAEE
ncbi:MAG: twin-arginine translocase TatA/TatE family subunit [Calditrichaceae bacterium]|jgi:sec-independent protein translocase protein TatA